jgi:hypothetical protein
MELSVINAWADVVLYLAVFAAGVVLIRTPLPPRRSREDAEPTRGWSGENLIQAIGVVAGACLIGLAVGRIGHIIGL